MNPSIGTNGDRYRQVSLYNFPYLLTHTLYRIVPIAPPIIAMILNERYTPTKSLFAKKIPEHTPRIPVIRSQPPAIKATGAYSSVPESSAAIPPMAKKIMLRII